MNHLIPTLLLLACSAVCADVLIEQKTESRGESRMTKMKVKDGRARVDTEFATGNITAFIEPSGEMVTYMHQSKLALITTMSDSEKAAKDLIKKAGADPAKPDPLTNSGEIEKIGDWNCEIWVRHTPSVTHKEWRTKDVPNLQQIQEQMTALASAPGMGLGESPQSDTYTVKVERSSAKGTITTTVTKIAMQPIPKADFTAPEGYREMAVPAQ